MKSDGGFNLKYVEIICLVENGYKKHMKGNMKLWKRGNSESIAMEIQLWKNKEIWKYNEILKLDGNTTAQAEGRCVFLRIFCLT